MALKLAALGNEHRALYQFHAFYFVTVLCVVSEAQERSLCGQKPES